MNSASDRVHISPDRSSLGRRAASDIAEALRILLSTQPRVRVIFAAAPSQIEMLAALRERCEIDWARVTAFHMDEYIGLPETAPQNFRNWLRREFFDHVPVQAHCLVPGIDPTRSARQYGSRLAEATIDIVCLGIGVNGHLAFNDPPADFADPEDVRLVQLQLASREQQVSDGCFTTLGAVPTHAITLTIPRLLRAGRLFCCVPGAIKRNAVTRALTGPVDPSSPASILRTHPCCQIYLDADSASGLQVDGE